MQWNSAWKREQISEKQQEASYSKTFKTLGKNQYILYFINSFFPENNFSINIIINFKEDFKKINIRLKN